MRTHTFALLLATCVLAGRPVAGQQDPDRPPPPSIPADAAKTAETTAAPAPPGPGEVVRERHPNGAVKVERTVVQDGKGNFVNHGPWTAYYPDGKKVGGGEMVQGNRHGLWTRWYAPGEGSMFANPLYREYTAPYFSEATFDHGTLHGAWKVYDKRKTLISDWSFDHGKQHGIWTWWYESGQKRREAHYVGGVQHGPAIEWSPEGKVVSQVEWIDGRAKVWWSDSYDGRKSVEGWYLEPLQVTKTDYDWYAGHASTVVVGEKGGRLKHGKWTWWFPNGQKSVEGAYQAGVEDGPWTWWHPNGQKWIVGAYAAGKRVDTWNHWAPNGTVEKTVSFPKAATPVVEGSPAVSDIPPPVATDDGAKRTAPPDTGSKNAAPSVLPE